MIAGYVLAEQVVSTIPAGAEAAEAIVGWYLSSHGFDSAAADSPASQHFDALVMQPLLFDRTMIGGDRIGGIAPSSGEIECANGDGALDALLTRFAIDGRRVVVRLGRPTFSYAEYGTLFDGVAAGLVADDRVLRVQIRDSLHKLDVPMQSTFYAGTGGTEGGADLAGRPKPICYGQVHNVPAIAVDTANLVYQVHAGAINAVTAVYDRGVALAAVVSGAPGVGEYEVDLANGTFTLGGAPSGQVTADVQGDATGGYVSSTGAICRRIVTTVAGLTDADIDNPALAELETDSAAVVGIWIGTEQRRVIDVLDELLRGVGGFAGFTRTGRLRMGVFKAPSGAAARTFTDEDILSIQRELPPGETHPPNWRRSVGYQRNYTVQTDLAGSVDSDRRAFAAQLLRVAVAADASVQTRHLLATDPAPVAGLFATEADAEAEATRLLALYSPDRFIYRIRVKRAVWGLDLNDVVTLEYPRYGLEAGRDGRVVAIREDAQRNEAELAVFI